MQTFFHGWRRKAGVITLGLALAVTGAWVRSVKCPDVIVYSNGNRWYSMCSHEGELLLNGWAPGNPCHQQLRGMQHYSDISYGHPFDATDQQHWVIPYWFLAMVPTLLSAFLLLWKPRKRSSPTDDHR